MAPQNNLWFQKMLQLLDYIESPLSYHQVSSFMDDITSILQMAPRVARFLNCFNERLRRSRLKNQEVS